MKKAENYTRKVASNQAINYTREEARKQAGKYVRKVVKNWQERMQEK